MMYAEKQKWFVSTQYGDDKLAVESIAEIVKASNVKLNVNDVETVLNGLEEGKIAMLKKSWSAVNYKGNAETFWLWYNTEDFVHDVLTYIGMLAKGHYFIYYDSDDFIEGYNFVQLS